MRKTTATAIALTALLVVAFQNCGKLGFSLASNGRPQISASLSTPGGTATNPAPTLNVTAEVPVAAGGVAQLTILAENTTSDVAYSCVASEPANSGDQTPPTYVTEGQLKLTDGVATLAITVPRELTCTFSLLASAVEVKTTFEIPIEGSPTTASPGDSN